MNFYSDLEVRLYSRSTHLHEIPEVSSFNIYANFISVHQTNLMNVLNHITRFKSHFFNFIISLLKLRSHRFAEHGGNSKDIPLPMMEIPLTEFMQVQRN